MPKSAVIDSSSLIILYKSGLLEKITGLYSLFISSSVCNEISQNGHSGADVFIKYIENDTLKMKSFDISENGSMKNDIEMISLGAGERETLCLYINGTGDFIIVDDRKAATICRKRNLKYINALLIPRILAIAGMSSAEESKRDIQKIISLGRYSSSVIEYASTCSEEKLSMYL